MLFSNNSKNFIFYFLFFSFISLIGIFIGQPIYGTTDDNTLSGFVSGGFTGEPEKRLIFIRPLMGEFFFIFQKLIPNVEIYSWILLILVIFSSSIFGTILSYKSHSKIINLLWMMFIVPFIVWFILTPNYTSASMILSVFGILSFMILLSTQVKSKFLYISSALNIILGYLIRPEGFFGTLILLAPVLFYVLFFKKNYKKIKILKVAFLTFFVLVIIIVDLILYKSTSAIWQNYDAWNILRHQIQHRNSQNYLTQMVENNIWSIPEYHLFMDLAFGDPKIFTFNWLNMAFQKTEFARSINFIFDYLSLQDLYLNLIRLIKNYFGLIIFEILMIVFFLKSIKINFGDKIILLIISFSTTIFSLIYLLIFLHTPDRTVYLIFLTPILILLSIIYIFDLSIIKLHKTISLIIILIGLCLYLIQPVGVVNQYKSNLISKKKDLNNLNELLNFNRNAIYIGPGHSELFETRNPYLEKSIPKIPKLLISGNWDTFSPHWDKRKKHLGIKEDSIYESLLSKNTFWLANKVPDTAYIIELYLNEKLKLDIERTALFEFESGMTIYKFSIKS